MANGREATERKATESEAAVTRLPLSGVRVLEFSHAVLGPTAGLLLADFGAEVIRVERTPHGDDTRRLRGFGTGYYGFFNRNKKSFVVDLKTEAGRAAVDKLLGTADVLIENFGPGTMDRLGLGHEALSERFPRLIYCALKGFLPGPYERRTALDEVVQMMSGLAYMTGPPGQPLRAGASIVDITTGIYGAVGVLLALRERESSGRGGLVRAALFETAAFIMGQHMAYSALSDGPVVPMPARTSAWGIYHQFETQEGELVFLGVTSDKQWASFCETFERADLLADESLRTNNQRVAAQKRLLPKLRRMFHGMSKAQILERAEAARVSFAPIARPEDLFDDPQLNAGGSLLDVVLPSGTVNDRAEGTSAKLPTQPLRLNDFVWSKRADPPPIGAHTFDLLCEVGYTDEQVSRLAAEGVVVLREG